MALRPPGRLIAQKIAYEGVLSQRIIDLLDKYFAQSMQTVYSQRSRFVRENYGRPPPTPMRMGKTDWKRHRIWLSRNAQPKKYYSDKWKRGKRVPLNQLIRYKTLSKPKYRRRKFNGKRRQRISNVKRAALQYELSQRTQQLARVLARFQCKKFNYNYRPASTVTWQALNAVHSERTAELATPKQVRKQPMRKVTIYGVVPDALKYTLTERTGQLAAPKPIYVPSHPEEDELIVIEERELTMYGVSTTAMKYNATAKILELAKPREPPMEPMPDYPYVDRPKTKYNVVENALKYKISDRILQMSKPR